MARQALIDADDADARQRYARPHGLRPKNDRADRHRQERGGRARSRRHADVDGRGVSGFDVAADNGRVAVAGRGPVLFTLFLASPVPDDINFIEDTGAPVRAAHKRFASISIYRRGVPFPDGPTRVRASEISKRSPSNVDVVVLEGSELWASAARGILTGIFLLTPGHAEHKVASNVDDAVDIVAKGLPCDRGEVQKTWALFQMWRNEAR